MFDEGAFYSPIYQQEIILEVKYDNYIPSSLFGKAVGLLGTRCIGNILVYGIVTGLFPTVVEDTLVGIVARVGAFNLAHTSCIVYPSTQTEVKQGIKAETFPVEIGTECTGKFGFGISNE